MVVYSLDSLLVMAFAAFRMARFVVVDNGPFGLMARIRNSLSPVAADAPRHYLEMLHCIHCVGVYTAAIALALYLLHWDIPLFILAIAGAVSLMRDLIK